MPNLDWATEEVKHLHGKNAVHVWLWPSLQTQPLFKRCPRGEERWPEQKGMPNDQHDIF